MSDCRSAAFGAIAACLAASLSSFAPAWGQSGTAEENLRRLETARTEVERDFVIGPAAAGALGYRVAWQTRVQPQAGATIRLTRAIGDGLFTLDSRNAIARLRPTDGVQLWRMAIASPVEVFRNAHLVDMEVAVAGRANTAVVESRFFLSTDTDVWVLDGSTGSLVSRQRFAKLPSTPPVQAGRFLIYGTLGGQIVWHQFLVGQEWRANAVDSPIRAPLAHGQERVVAASDRGQVICLDDETARRRWSQRCFGGVFAAPAIGDNRAYVASEDQYLWCFDLGDGSVLWKYFTERPLRTAPFAIPGAVLQFVPDEGLVCLAADSEGRPGGLVRWRITDAVGVPRAILGNAVVLWDEATRTLTRVHAQRGSVIDRLELPQVSDLQFVTEGAFAGDILATNEDGRVVRLVPRQAGVAAGRGRALGEGGAARP
jgi:outer membrane protein assembly factor BamB